MKAGLQVNGFLDAAGLGALKMDCNLKDWQVKRMLRHLKSALGDAKVSVPFNEIKQFSLGYTVPKTKKWKHQYPDGKLEWITCEYQPVDEAFTIVVSELLLTKK